MKVKKWTLLVLLLIFSFNSFAQSVGTIASIVGDVKLSKEGRNWFSPRLGEGINEFVAIKVRDKSYAKVMLADNTLIHIGSDTFLSLVKKKGKLHVNLGRGRIRLLSYKGEKVIRTPQREFSLYSGEYLVDVNQKNSILRTDLTAYSGHLFHKGEVVLPKEYSKRPEDIHGEKYTIEEPYSYYFPKVEEGVNYDIAITPPKKAASRGIASVEIDKEPFDSEFQIDEEKGEIWVHDIIFDETVRVIEELVYREVEKLAPIAIKEASSQLVWDVAGKSMKRWGVYFARESEDQQVPLAVKSSYENQLRDNTQEDTNSFHYYDSYESSTKKVAEIRTYRVAKVLVETKGYEKAWRETHQYVMDLLPKVVNPLLVKDIYEKVRPLAKKPVMEVIKKSELVYSKDVDRLIKHITYLTARRLTERIINTRGKEISKQIAKEALRSVSQSVSHDIATYMADKAKERAGSLVATLFARKRARSVASEVAEETNEKIYQNAQKKQRRLLFESTRQ